MRHLTVIPVAFKIRDRYRLGSWDGRRFESVHLYESQVPSGFVMVDLSHRFPDDWIMPNEYHFQNGVRIACGPFGRPKVSETISLQAAEERRRLAFMRIALMMEPLFWMKHEDTRGS